MEYHSFTLSNGIKVIHQPKDSQVAHLGLLINTGTRDEPETQEGIAHFIEHLLFKGTRKRKAYHIISRLEDTGGELSAYTTKEETCIYSTFIKNDYNRALELLADMVFNSTYPVKEMAKEKDVVIDEILSYEDSPSDLIYDEFENFIFKSHPIGRNILGSKTSLEKITQQDILNFIQSKYHTDQMVLSSIGNIDKYQFEKQVRRYFEDIPANLRDFKRKAFTNYQTTHHKENKDTVQSHCILGNIAYPYSHPKRFTLALLNNLMGGSALNSRLNFSLREKKGLVYNIESNYAAYSDTGLITIYFGTDKKNLDKSLKLIRKEFNKVIEKPLGSMQLNKAKKQIIGQSTIAAENKESMMLAAAKEYFYFNRIRSNNEINEIIQQVNAQDIQQVAAEMLDPDKMSSIIYD